jgi:hypothetical protein
MARQRISRSIDEFAKYIVVTYNYIIAGTPETNGERLGLLPAEITKWKAFLDKWTPLFLLYSDITNSRTRAIRNTMVQIIDDLIAYDQDNHILDRIAASPNVTIDDLGIFNIYGGALPKTTRTVPTTPIKEPVTVTFQALGGSTMAIKCYSITGSRASIYEDADSVQYLYHVGTTAPVAPNEDTMKTGISTKASYTMNLSTDSSGKYLYMYFRWYNTKHPELSGPWSGLQSNMIM